MTLSFNIPTEMRRMSHAQTSNLGERIGIELRDPATGVPPSDTGMRVLAEDIVEQTLNFDLRVRLDRTNAFTQRKEKHEKDRDKFSGAIRRGLKTILREPEETVLPARRQAATLLQELLDRRGKNFEEQGAGENSTQLKYLFEDFDTTAAQAALSETDLLRMYVPLKEAQEQFIQIVREQEEAEAKVAALPPVRNPKNLPHLPRHQTDAHGSSPLGDGKLGPPRGQRRGTLRRFGGALRLDLQRSRPDRQRPPNPRGQKSRQGGIGQSIPVG